MLLMLQYSYVMMLSEFIGALMNLPENAISFSPSLAKKIGLQEAIVLQWLASLSAVDAYRGFNVDVKLCQHRLSFMSVGQLDQVFQQLHQLGYINLQRSENGSWQGHISQPTEVTSESKGNLAANLPVPELQTQPASSLKADAVELNPVQQQTQSAANSPAMPAATLNNPQNNQTRLRNQNPNTQIHYLKGQSRASSVTGLVAMTLDWQPSEQFSEMLQFHNISSSFALEQLAAFRVYYVQSGKTAFSWDTRFMNWVQRAWADQSKVSKGYEQTKANKEPQSDAKQRKEEVRQQLRNIHDTSWAD